jgi:hypothetical protein
VILENLSKLLALALEVFEPVLVGLQSVYEVVVCPELVEEGTNAIVYCFEVCKERAAGVAFLNLLVVVDA